MFSALRIAVLALIAMTSERAIVKSLQTKSLTRLRSINVGGSRCFRMAASSDGASDGARILFVTPEAGAASSFGRTSPSPRPDWITVADHLSKRIPEFDPRLRASTVASGALPLSGGADVERSDILLVLGVKDAGAEVAIEELAAGWKPNPIAVLCYDCSPAVQALQRVSGYSKASDGLLQTLRESAVPWGDVASGGRLSAQADLLLKRNSTEDLLYALFFILHRYVINLDLVKHTLNPTWEKGPVRNAQEFANMCSTCGNQIASALTDPETKATIDKLNACDMCDQVGSYRVIVSYETPQLEAFSLCILQQNNCFNCDAEIISTPRVPLLKRWRGDYVDQKVANQIFIGHFDCPDAHPQGSRLPWSWKVVCGANPAYDAFPCQHLISYPSDKSKSALWYDPVFKVETLDGRQVWTKRHYRCMPRKVDSDLRAEGDSSAGAWTLTTLDNGVLSKEHWTTVDVADDLSWAVFHYSGAAAVVGQSYLGALLCSVDGKWPESASSGPEFERIVAAFEKCSIAMWELYGHGPPGGESFMWNDEQIAWSARNPPPLEPIGDVTIQAWRSSEKEKVAA